MTKIQKIIASVITILIIMAGALWYVFDRKGSISPSGSQNNTTGTSTQNGVSVNGVSIDASVPAGNVTPVNVKTLPKAPSLDRKINYSSSITSDVRAIIDRSVSATATDLKKNPYSLQDWIGLGIAYKEAGDYQAARDAWEYASLLSPGNVVTFNNLGDLYHYYLKDYPKAESNFLQAIKNDKKYVLSYINLANLYKLSYQTNTTKAADILKQGIAANPEDIDLVIQLATYYKEKGDNANARIYYEQVLVKAQTAKNQKLIDSIQAELDALK
jgi:tetratricopeptide (TPR) repeat protein